MAPDYELRKGAGNCRSSDRLRAALSGEVRRVAADDRAIARVASARFRLYGEGPADRSPVSFIGVSENLAGKTLYEFVRDDFINAWEAMVEAGRKGGNFLFARQAMALLELACRVAAEAPPVTLRHFSEQLNEIEGRYFTRLPGKVPLPRDFHLPSVARTPINESLIAALFDLIRHGQAHQYQQIPVELPDGHYFGVTLTGVEPGKVLDHLRYGDGKRPPQRPPFHLSYRRTENGNLWLVVCPEVIFLDLRMAADRASVFSGGFDPKYLERPHREEHYGFAVDELHVALRDSGHLDSS